jgi:hypothetical protein
MNETYYHVFKFVNGTTDQIKSYQYRKMTKLSREDIRRIATFGYSWISTSSLAVYSFNKMEKVGEYKKMSPKWAEACSPKNLKKYARKTILDKL